MVSNRNPKPQIDFQSKNPTCKLVKQRREERLSCDEWLSWVESVARNGFHVLHRWKVFRQPSWGMFYCNFVNHRGEERLSRRWDWRISICTENEILVKYQSLESCAGASVDFVKENHRAVQPNQFKCCPSHFSHTCMQYFLSKKFN